MNFCDKSSHGKKKKRYWDASNNHRTDTYKIYMGYIYLYCVAAQLHIHYYMYIISCNTVIYSYIYYYIIQYIEAVSNI